MNKELGITSNYKILNLTVILNLFQDLSCVRLCFLIYLKAYGNRRQILK